MPDSRLSAMKHSIPDRGAPDRDVRSGPLAFFLGLVVEFIFCSARVRRLEAGLAARWERLPPCYSRVGIRGSSSAWWFSSITVASSR
jgi:hypothetical protein